MSWAAHAIGELAAGRSVTVTPRGNSMRPKVRSGARVLLEPVADPASLAKNDIVLVKVGGSVYLHLIAAAEGQRVQIASNRGRVNGWVARERVYGRAVRIDNP